VWERRSEREGTRHEKPTYRKREGRRVLE